MSRNVYATRYMKIGDSWGMIIPKHLRERLGFRPGDLIVMALYGELVMLRRMQPRDVVELESIPTDALPPATIG